MFIILSIFSLFPFGASAAIQTTPNVSNVTLQYLPSRDQYALNYYFSDPANGMQYVFVADINGQTYSKVWPAEAINKTIYINCNGTGDWYFKLEGVSVGYIMDVVSTEIENEICQVKIPTEDDYNLNLTGTGGNASNGAGYGQYRVDYSKVPGGANYQLQRSTNGGTSWSTVGTDNGTSGYFTTNASGLYRLNAFNNSNELIATDIIGQNEFQKPCGELCQVFTCPGWEQFAGGLSDVISNSIPTPAELGEAIGDSIVDKLAEQDVSPDDPVVPEPFDPGYQEQETDLPAPVTTDINPQPTDFEPVTTGDGSGSFDLTDPLDWTPDDEDKEGGYVPPNPDADTPPEYQEGEPTDDTPPAYDSGDVGEMPNYETTDPGTPPSYDAGDPGDEIPNYNYGG